MCTNLHFENCTSVAVSKSLECAMTPEGRGKSLKQPIMDVLSSPSSHERFSSVPGESPEENDIQLLGGNVELLIKQRHRSVAFPGPGAWKALSNPPPIKDMRTKLPRSKGIMKLHI